MQQLFIGVDGGGTRLRVCVKNATGEQLFNKAGNGSNIRTSVTATWDAILSLLRQGFSEIGMTFPQQNIDYYASLGLAGIEYQPALEMFLNHPHPFHELIITSDARIACLGAHGDNDGAIIIIGTGIIGYQREGEVTTRVGGWGFPHDDEGSGGHLGLLAVRALFKAFDGRSQPTYLVSEMQKRWETPDQLLTYFHQGEGKLFAQLVPLIFEAAEKGDEVAIQLIQRTCHAIYEIHEALRQQQMQDEAPLPLTLLGGLASPLRPYLSDEFKEGLREPLMSAEQGALLLFKS